MGGGVLVQLSMRLTASRKKGVYSWCPDSMSLDSYY